MWDRSHPEADHDMDLTCDPKLPNSVGDTEYLDLSTGYYLVEFNESVNMPLDLMGQILVRSSLFRSGALIQAGVMDSGYEGAVGAMLQVLNPHGLRLTKNAKLAQMIFHQMSEPVEGYSGAYQGRTFV
ncbi:dUTP diphosphatase [Phaeosphaeria sp. MPI-PUGE-AT-0046c]|nr:dUTP diphosphatase [Phaeosphaeria sp. MPI-PUGE-AT-0046c]